MSKSLDKSSDKGDERQAAAANDQQQSNLLDANIGDKPPVAPADDVSNRKASDVSNLDSGYFKDPLAVAMDRAVTTTQSDSQFVASPLDVVLTSTREVMQRSIIDLSETLDLTLPQARIEVANTVLALNHLARDEQFADKLFVGGAVLEQGMVRDALILNGCIYHPDASAPTGQDNFLTHEQNHSALSLIANWSKLGCDFLTRDGIANFSNTDVASALSDTASSMAVHQPQALFESLRLPKATQYDPLVNLQNFAVNAEKLLKKMDKDGDGSLSMTQIAVALQDPKIRGGEAQTLAALYAVRKALEHLHSDSRSGVSFKDLEEFKRIERKSIVDWTAVEQLEPLALDPEKFKQYFGKTAVDEVDLRGIAEDNVNRTALERFTAGYLLKGIIELNRISTDHNNRLGPRDLADLVVSFQNSSDLNLLKSAYHTINRTKLSQQGQCHVLYADVKNPLDSVKPGSVNQGSIGDCHFEAALSAVANNNPSSILRMIKDNKNGSYTVTFPGAPGEPITVNAPTEAEQGLFNRGGPDGFWSSVVEKAYGTFRQNNWTRHSPLNALGGDTPSEGGDGGGRADALDLLTGKQSDFGFILGDFTKPALENAFAKKPHRSAVAFTRWDPLSSVTQDQFYRQHAYTILDYDPANGGIVTIRNPWGGPDNTVDGTIRIPFDKFARNFFTFAIEKP